MKQETKQKELLNELNQFSGSIEFTRDPLSKCVITEGFSHLIEEAGCHWLFSDYAIEIMMTPRLRQEDFIVLTIKVKDKKGYVTLDDGNGNIIHKKEYGYTDFPLEEYSFYIVKNELNSYTFMLKGEY